MTEPAIKVEGVSKRYRIGARQAPYRTLREVLADVAAAPLRRLRRMGGAPAPEETIWALKDVSFEVAQGEVVGIIGPNGAGKTTLLKILSRITEPTEGRAEIRGRVGSLLEVGTGFHPELTGRENVYLSGAILGMTRREINVRFDEIADFSGVEQFLDTPVKHYSSGMLVRLGFAVAAHLDPEVLLVDEVLAVGDAAFQKKCLGRMDEVARGGRTVLLVSHNMAAVRSLCQRAVLLHEGRVKKIGSPADTIEEYVSAQVEPAVVAREVPDEQNSGYVLIRPERELSFRCGEEISFEFQIRCPRPFSEATAGVIVFDAFGEPVLGASSKHEGICGAGEGSVWLVRCNMGKLPLNAGRYRAGIWFGNRQADLARFPNALAIEVTPGDPFGWGSSVPAAWGHFFWKPEWRLTPAADDTRHLADGAPSKPG